MKLPSIIALLLIAFFVAVAPSVGTAEPAYPGEPHINNALKHLNAAKEKVATDTDAALGELNEARIAISHSIKNKGTYKNITKQQIEQAAEYLKQGDKEKAGHKIDEAIANANLAGEHGER